jgi:hypothetical protein
MCATPKFITVNDHPVGVAVRAFDSHVEGPGSNPAQVWLDCLSRVACKAFYELISQGIRKLTVILLEVIKFKNVSTHQANFLKSLKLKFCKAPFPFFLPISDEPYENVQSTCVYCQKHMLGRFLGQ